MTPEYRLERITETIRVIKIGVAISKTLVRLPLEPWPDLYWNAMTREGEGLDQSASGSGRSDRACLGVTDTVPAARTCNGIQHIPLPAVADPDGGDWLTPDFARAGDAITNFLSGTRRLRRKGPFSGQGISGRLCRR
jgi:hypothetical protein